MRIAILQIGDIHIKSAADEVLERGQQVIAALRSLALQLDGCYAVFPGDIAFSGLVDEYAAAEFFVTELLRGIEQEYPGLRPHALFVPGNHDCDLKSSSDVRDIEFLQPKLRQLKLSGDIVDHCLAVQANFFSFVAKFGQIQSRTVDQLCVRREIPTSGGRRVGFTLINTAWLTQNPEHAGHLYFPTEAIGELETAADLELCVFHHPYNWLEPDNLLQFRDAVERRSDVIVTGHQHFSHRFRKENEDGTSAYYIEGLAMFDPKSEVNGFNIIDTDLNTGTWAVHQFHWSNRLFRLANATSRRPLLRNRALVELGFQNNADFLGYLSDPGAGFTHPRKKDVRLHDIFVYPSLRQRDIQQSIEKSRPSVANVNGKHALDFFRDQAFVLIIGDDKAGKTALIKTLYSDFQRDCNMVTLLIDGRQVSSQEVRDTPNFLRRIIAEQYQSTVVDAFMQLPRERRAVLIDDFDGSTISRAARESFLVAVEHVFQKVIVSVGSRFDIDFVAGKAGQPVFSKYRQYAIAEMGHARRGRLISKWVGLGRDEYDLNVTYIQEVDAREKLVRTLIGRQLLPSFPIIILGILQALEAARNIHTASGSYGELYEALITDRLAAISEKATDLGTTYTILSHVAYAMFEREVKVLIDGDVRDIYDAYFAQFRVRVNIDRLIEDLRSVGILDRNDGHVRFRYPYYYHFFVARYFRDNVGDAGEAWKLRGKLQEMATCVYFEEYANILVFYVYLTKDLEVIGLLLTCAKRIFADRKPCDMEKSIANINALYISPPKPIALPPANVEANREEYRDRLDEIEDGSEKTQPLAGEKLPYSDELDEVAKFTIGMQVLHLLGQVVRNFPGSLRHQIKTDITKECYLLGLRMLTCVLRSVDVHQDFLREYFARMIRDQRASARTSQLPRSAEEAILRLVEVWAFAMIKKVSQSVGLPELEETYREILSAHGDLLSIRLVDVSIKLDHFGTFPQNEIEYAFTRTRKNLFAKVLLRDLVVHFFYLFEAEPHVKAKYCKMLDIDNAPRPLLESGLRKEDAKV